MQKKYTFLYVIALVAIVATGIFIGDSITGMVSYEITTDTEGNSEISFSPLNTNTYKNEIVLDLPLEGIESAQFDITPLITFNAPYQYYFTGTWDEPELATWESALSYPVLDKWYSAQSFVAEANYIETADVLLKTGCDKVIVQLWDKDVSKRKVYVSSTIDIGEQERNQWLWQEAYFGYPVKKEEEYIITVSTACTQESGIDTKWDTVSRQYSGWQTSIKSYSIEKTEDGSWSEMTHNPFTVRIRYANLEDNIYPKDITISDYYFKVFSYFGRTLEELHVLEGPLKTTTTVMLDAEKINVYCQEKLFRFFGDPESCTIPFVFGGKGSIKISNIQFKTKDDTEDTPVDDTPIDNTPVQTPPVIIEDTPVDDTPIDNTPVQTPPVVIEDTPVDDTPIDNTPVQTPPVIIEDTPGDQGLKSGDLLVHIDVGGDESAFGYKESGSFYDPVLGTTVPGVNLGTQDGRTVRWAYSLGYDRSSGIQSWFEYTADVSTNDAVKVVFEYNGLTLPSARNKFYITLNGDETNVQDINAPANSWVKKEFTDVIPNNGKVTIRIADEEETSTAGARFSDIWIYKQ